MGLSTEIDDYICALSADRREALAALRNFIHDSVPDLSESMAYKMPTFETTDIVCSLASQKNYMSLYVCAVDLVAQRKQELSHLNCGKSCIRFKKFDDLPLDTIRDILVASAESPGFQHS